MVKNIKYKDREEWLAIRRDYIGGSEAGCVVGMNPYKSAYALWAEKTGRIPEFEGNIATTVGAYLEDLVAHMFQDETGKTVKRHNATMVNDKYPFACANVDRLIVGEKALLEIKTTNSLPNMRKIKGGEFPDTWYCQVVHYLAVTELEKAYLAVLVNCREFHVFELERDEAEISSLMGAEREFWSCVTNNTPPAPDGSESTSEAISAMYPESNDNEVNLMAYDSDLRQYIAIGNQIKELQTIQKEHANKVKAFMNESGKGFSDGFKVSWVSSERRTFDTKRFAAEHPEIDLSDYYNTTATRTFKVTEIKN